jgi:hypothetical protein
MEHDQDSSGSGASHAPAARSAELRSLSTPGPWYVLDGRRVSWASPYREVGDGFSSYCVAITQEWPGLIDAEANARLIAAAPELLAAAEAAVAYDAEIQGCANNPDRMASHCTAQGQTLDDLYERWIALSLAALAKAGVKP